MKTNNFSYTIKTKQPAAEVFQRLLDPKKWWVGFYEETIEGKSEQLNDEFRFIAGGGMHDTKQRLVELLPGKKIVWLVTNSNLSFLDRPEEWKGTRFGFELNKEGNDTLVTFTHEGLTPEIECFDQCSAGWNSYLHQLNKELN